MKKIATVLTIPMCLGLAVAQETPTTPRSTGSSHDMGNGQSWVGILVDSKCSSPGMDSAGAAANSTRTSAMSRTTPKDSGSIMERGTPAQSGRDVNTTDRNTSGVADRVGATAGNTAGARDMSHGTTPTEINRTSSASDLNRGTSSNDLNRGTATDRGTPTGTDRGTADRSTADRARNTPSDMPRSTGNPTDTQSANNPERNSIGDVATANNRSSWDRSCFISPSSSSFVLQLQDGRTLKVDDAGNSRINSQLQSTGRVSKTNKVFRVKVNGSVNGDTIHITDIQM